ncbi:MAG: GNAT family N-acetyltransferase [Bacteroidota bacterium]
MEPLIVPVERDLIENELTEDKFIRKTRNGNNLIYIFDHFDSPNLIRELGRLRELTFRDAGGGTGHAMDIDQFDITNPPFKQLIVWNPNDREIVGGYRFIHGKEFKKDAGGEIKTPTSELFKFSEKFISDYLPHTVELGRSFVQPQYQPQYNIRRGMYSLDNIWDGLGAILVENHDVTYFFGKMTMFKNYNSFARDIILFFLQKHFPDPENLLSAIKPVEFRTEKAVLEVIFSGKNYDEDYKILFQKIRSMGENIPPLVNIYMNLSATMKTFGTSTNDSFGEVEETGIMIKVSDIYEEKKERHLSY